MQPIATIGNLVEVTPWDDLQFRESHESDWIFLEDKTPFRFRVQGKLHNGGDLCGLYGSVESGPALFTGLICSIMIRSEPADWESSRKCQASFKIGPSAVLRSTRYEPEKNGNIVFFKHPDGTYIEGYPQISRFGGVSSVGQV